MLGNHFSFSAALHYTAGFGYYEQYMVDQELAKYGLTTTGLKSDLIRRKNMRNDFFGGVYALNYKQNRLEASLGGAINHYNGRHFGTLISVINPVVTNYPDNEYYRNKA